MVSDKLSLSFCEMQLTRIVSYQTPFTLPKSVMVTDLIRMGMTPLKYQMKSSQRTRLRPMLPTQGNLWPTTYKTSRSSSSFSRCSTKDLWHMSLMFRLSGTVTM